MGKHIKFFLVLIITLGIDFFLLSLLKYNGLPEIKNIRLVEYDKKKEQIILEIEKSHDYILELDFECIVSSNDKEYKKEGYNNKCIMTLPINDDYNISIKTNYGKTKNIKLLEYIGNKLDFKFEKENIYLAVDEEHTITYTDKYIFPVDTIYEFYSEDENIAKVENGKILGINPGTTKIKVKDSNEFATVTVTDLITKPILAKEKKQIVPCGAYTDEENKILDELLKSYVEEAGFGTRAGAVAAGRFLTLQFKYRVPYFYENGRIPNDKNPNNGVHLADGEGRYYKEGLYLSESKFEDIKYKYAGPVTWGCPLRNGQNNPKYGYRAGNKMPNGLDCSGFVSWALVNGGFDPGDVGAGQNEGIYQLTDTGEFTTLTKNLAMSGKIKTGDLFNFWGHIALIIGQDEENFYVAESLPHLGGVIAKTYPKEKVANTFEFVVFMDSFYGEDGNLTDYWE